MDKTLNKRKLCDSETSCSIESKKIKNEVFDNLDLLPIEIIIKITEYLNISDIICFQQVSKKMLDKFKNNKYLLQIVEEKMPVDCTLTEVVDFKNRVMVCPSDDLNDFLSPYILSCGRYNGYRFTDSENTTIELNNSEIFGSFYSYSDECYSFRTNKTFELQNTSLFRKENFIKFRKLYDRNLLIYENCVYDMDFKKIFNFDKKPCFLERHKDILIVDDLIITAEFNRDVTKVEGYKIGTEEQVFETTIDKEILNMNYNGEYIIIVFRQYNKCHDFKLYFYKLERSENSMIIHLFLLNYNYLFINLRY